MKSQKKPNVFVAPPLHFIHKYDVMTTCLYPLLLKSLPDNSIRGRLCSFFTLTMNTGILVGFIVSSHVAYRVIPCAVVGLPILYALLATRYPEPPQMLIRWNREEDAQRSLRFYRCCDGPNTTKEEERAYQKEFDEMRAAILQQNKDSDDKGLSVADFSEYTPDKGQSSYL